MQVIELELNHFNFYNPANGALICSNEQGHNLEEKSFIGYWMDEVINEPFVKDEKLLKAWEEAWEKSLDDEEAADDDELLPENADILDRFFKNYEHEGWFVFKITTGPEAGGPGYETVWFVLDLFE